MNGRWMIHAEADTLKRLSYGVNRDWLLAPSSLSTILIIWTNPRQVKLEVIQIGSKPTKDVIANEQSQETGNDMAKKIHDKWRLR